MTQTARKPETEILSKVRTLLEAQHFDVYPEVPVTLHDRRVRADLVAVNIDGVVVVVEGKATLTQGLVDQCERWLPYANRVWAAVGAWPRTNATHARVKQLVTRGIGLIIAEKHPVMKVEAQFSDQVTTRVIAANLSTCQKALATAGEPGGRRITRREERNNPLRELLEAEPGLTAKEIAHALDWKKSQRTELLRNANKNQFPHGITAVTDRGQLRFYLETES